MEMNDLLWMMTLAVSIFGSVSFRVKRVKGQDPDFYLMLSMLILLSYWVIPEWCGTFSIGLWIWCVIFGRRVVEWRGWSKTAQQYLWRNRLVLFFRPQAFEADFSRFYRGLRSINQGKNQQALEHFSRLNGLKNRWEICGRGVSAILKNEYTDFITWLDQNPNLRLISPGDYELFACIALGESGQISRYLAQYDPLYLRQLMDPTAYNHFEMILRSVVLAYAGIVPNEQNVSTMSSVIFIGNPHANRDFWNATALQRAGRENEAQQTLLRNTNQFEGIQKIWMQRRLSSPLAPVNEELNDSDLQIKLSHLQRVQSGSSLMGRAPDPLVTYGLMAILIVIFLLELPVGELDGEKLYELGGMMVPSANGDAAWWRPFTAAFLHAGWIHLAMNCLGISFLGNLIERLYGRWQYLISYLICAVGAMQLAPLIIEVPPHEQHILVGASGGVMGLIAMLAVQMAVQSMTEKSKASSRMLRTLLLLITIQVYIDQMVAEVSAEAHLMGLLLGVICGLFWNAISSINARRRRNTLRSTWSAFKPG